MTGLVGAAISTTGSAHRLRFLETAVRQWLYARVDALFVTVDGSADDAERVRRLLGNHGLTLNVYRVGQPPRVQHPPFNSRMGVAVNKNTGLELLMDACVQHDYPDIEHIFLADDDVWPHEDESLALHIDRAPSAWHSIVAWGASRLEGEDPVYAGIAHWKWPRGVVQYVHRDVVSRVGGMDERFGIGGHEHADWSRRINRDGWTPAPFVSPVEYADDHAMGARRFWHAEDMPREGEARHQFMMRKANNTTLTEAKSSEEWDRLAALMEENMKAESTFKSFRAAPNGRDAATLCSPPHNIGVPSRGAGGESK